MPKPRVLRIIGAVFATIVLLAAVLAQSVGVARADSWWNSGESEADALYVSPAGNSRNSGTSCDSATYSTIQSAVDAAPASGTVIVCAGTYTGNIVISSPLTLKGRSATIKGTATSDATCDQIGPTGPSTAPCLAAVTIKSSDVTIEGFRVQDGYGEAILATGSLAGGSISDVTIRHNLVVHNNVGSHPVVQNNTYPQCSAFGQVPGDCGEGIHLMGVENSRVSDNYVSDNEGGILLTDEFGPTHDNIVEGNTVTRNADDCGITVPGHNPNALDKDGNRQPEVAGVFHNVIRRNWITDNGLNGEGAGVLFANAMAGSASYENVVVENYIAGNELSGVTMHAHTLNPGEFEDLSGNQIIRNTIGRNNLGNTMDHGDPLDGPPVQDFKTTGVLVFSASVPVDVTIENNRIFDNEIGVWLGAGGNVTATLNHNSFFNVTTPVLTVS
jgi:parallel beta-helix repeat protein